MTTGLTICLALSLFITPASLASEEPGNKHQGDPASTAAPGVTVLTEQLHMPGLNRLRTIRLYLPPDYESSDNRYPVLYMHDAQNLFDKATAFAGEWQVDETLDKLANNNRLSLIVVGIDNGEDKRLNELSPWTNDNFGPAEGQEYAEFIVSTLKPFIDTRYRTLSDAQHTAVMGSSMGGLMSHYLIFQYPEVFSKAGIFSPSYWYSDKVYAYTQQRQLTGSHRLYMIVSNNEGEEMTSTFSRMTELLRGSGHQRLQSQIHSYGSHNEAYWAGETEDALLWLFQ